MVNIRQANDFLNLVLRDEACVRSGSDRVCVSARRLCVSVVSSSMAAAAAEGEEATVSLVDVLEEDEELEQEASAVLGGSDSEKCSYPEVRRNTHSAGGEKQTNKITTIIWKFVPGAQIINTHTHTRALHN